MQEVLFLLASNYFIGSLLCILCVPLIFRRIPPNRFYGFRTTKTLSDERIWYEANAIGGKWLFAAGALVIFGTVLVSIICGNSPSPLCSLARLLVVIVPIAIATVASLVHVRKL